MQLALTEIEALGATLVVVSPQLPDKSLATAEEKGLSFEVLSDVGNKVAREFGPVITLSEELRPLYANVGIDIPTINGDNTFELPIPATYIIDTDGTTTYAFVEADYFKRSEPSKIIEVLKSMKTDE